MRLGHHILGQEMLVGAVIACLAAALSVRLLRVPALRLGLVDHPNHRKRHEGAVPLIGGLALLIGYGAGVISAHGDWTPHWPLLVGTVVLAWVGLVDDLRQVSVRTRLAVQLAVALAAVGGGLQIDSLGNLLGTGTIQLGWLAIPFTVLCIVLMINAINMLDGADGLAGSVTLLAASGLVALALIAGMREIAFVAVILVGALLGFLFFNLRSPWLPRARVFMGDSGSMVLGFLLAWLAIALTQNEGPARIAPISVAWILLLPASDILAVFARRLRWRRSPMAGDRSHFHHVLLRSGFSVPRVVSIIAVNQLLLVVAAIVLHLTGVPEPLQFALLVVVFLGYATFALNSSRFLRAMRRRRQRRVAALDRLETAED